MSCAVEFGCVCACADHVSLCHIVVWWTIVCARAGVDTCITIGACDWQYFRPDRWAGHVLQVRVCARSVRRVRRVRRVVSVCGGLWLLLLLPPMRCHAIVLASMMLSCRHHTVWCVVCVGGGGPESDLLLSNGLTLPWHDDHHHHDHYDHHHHHHPHRHGHHLQAPGMPPYDPIHDLAGESGLPYGWWWTITGAVEVPDAAAVRSFVRVSLPCARVIASV